MPVHPSLHDEGLAPGGRHANPEPARLIGDSVLIAGLKSLDDRVRQISRLHGGEVRSEVQGGCIPCTPIKVPDFVSVNARCSDSAKSTFSPLKLRRLMRFAREKAGAAELQILAPRFDSGRGLQNRPIAPPSAAHPAGQIQRRFGPARAVGQAGDPSRVPRDVSGPGGIGE